MGVTLRLGDALRALDLDLTNPADAEDVRTVVSVFLRQYVRELARLSPPQRLVSGPWITFD